MVLFLFFLGAALGSFSLVLAWRMHAGRDWVKERSKCDKCKKELQPVDLVPVLSYVFLRGKCRYCKVGLPRTLFFAEVLMGFAAAASFLFWPFELTSVAEWLVFDVWVVILTLFSALFWYDLRWFILPNKLVYPVIGLSAVYAVSSTAVYDLSFFDGIIVPLLAGGLMSGVFFFMHTVSKGKWIGFGDVRLAVALGILVGTPFKAWLVIFFASLLGLILVAPQLLQRKRKLNTKIPFGPLLITATVIIVLFGDRLSNEYFRLIGV